MFWSYLSESGFSAMIIPKSKHRSQLNDKHSNGIMRVAISKCTPNYVQYAS